MKSFIFSLILFAGLVTVSVAKWDQIEKKVNPLNFPYPEQPKDKSLVTISTIGPFSGKVYNFKDLDVKMNVGEFKKRVSEFYRLPEEKFFLDSKLGKMDEDKTLYDYDIRNEYHYSFNIIDVELTDRDYEVADVTIVFPKELRNKAKDQLLSVRWFTTIEEIKKMIAAGPAKVPVEKQILKKGKGPLARTLKDDNKNLKDYGIHNLDDLYLKLTGAE